MTTTQKERGVGKAVKWAYIMNGGQSGLTALFTFVLASVLGPRDFGTVAMALVYLALIQVFLEQGLVATLIQRKDLRDDHLDSVFWMGLSLSLLLMGLSVGLSRWWAGVNHLPELALVISALSLLLPIEALDMVQRAILQREMDFKSLSVRENLVVAARKPAAEPTKTIDERGCSASNAAAAIRRANTTVASAQVTKP